MEASIYVAFACAKFFRCFPSEFSSVLNIKPIVFVNKLPSFFSCSSKLGASNSQINLLPSCLTLPSSVLSSNNKPSGSVSVTTILLPSLRYICPMSFLGISTLIVQAVIRSALTGTFNFHSLSSQTAPV